MQILYTFWHPKRKQRTKVNAPYSNFDEAFSGVTQGSTFLLGPLLFNIYIHDLFFRIGDLQMTSSAEDNTPFTSPVAFQIENTIISSANKCQTFRCSY